MLVNQELAIEIKANSQPGDKHLKGLRALMEEGLFKRFYLVCTCERVRRTEDGIDILPWSLFLERLWNDEILCE